MMQRLQMVFNHLIGIHQHEAMLRARAREIFERLIRLARIHRGACLSAQEKQDTAVPVFVLKSHGARCILKLARAGTLSFWRFS